MKDTLRESYDRSAPGYDERFRALQWPKYEALLGPGGELLRPLLTDGGRVLDLGCGTGLAAAFLGDQGLPTAGVLGLDLSAGMLAVAAARGLRAVQGDLEALPFRAASFDAVLAFTALRILPGPDAPALVEIARVLRPGGLLCVSVLAEGDDGRLPEELAAAGLRAGPRRRCGQDAGWVCRRR